VGKLTARAALLAATSIFLWPTIAASQQGGAGTSAPVPLPQAPTTTTPINPALPAVPTLASGAAVIGPGSGRAAPNTGGLQLDFGIKTSLKVDSNFPLTPGKSRGTSYISDNTLSYGLSSITQTTTFNLTGSAVLRYADIPGRSIKGLEDPMANVLYMTESANSRVTLRGRWRYVDRQFLDPFQVELEDLQTGLITDGGTVRDPSYSLRFETGLQSPFGLVLDLGRAEKHYSGTTNPLLFDTQTDTASLAANMRYNAVTQGSLTASATHYITQDFVQTNRWTRSLTYGLTRDVNGTLQVSGQIGYSEVVTDTILGQARNKGVIGGFGVTQQVQDGSYSVNLAANRNQNGLRTDLTFGRDMQLPTGSLKGTIGVTKGSVGGGAMIGSLSYSIQRPSDTLTLAIRRGATTNSSNQDILNTAVTVNWGHAVNSLSMLDMGVDYAETQGTGGSGANATRLTNLYANYNYTLTPDWALTTGVSYKVKTQTGLPQAKSTGVYVTLGRNFSFRP
jgi:hypothetical protein